MPQVIDKDLVRQRFRRSLATYDAHAKVQRRMAEGLVQALLTHCGKMHSKVLEIGSGTGMLTRQILELLTVHTLTTNDLVAECRRHSDALAHEFPHVPVQFIPGDIETLICPLSDFDLIASNAVLQWIQDLPGLLGRLGDMLASGGILAFTTFGPHNLIEVREATGTSLPYHDVKTLRSMLPANMTMVASEDYKETLLFQSPREVLEHIRSTGSNSLAHQSWTRKSLSSFEHQYRSSHQLDGHVTLTYHPVIMIARKGAGHHPASARRQRN